MHAMKAADADVCITDCHQMIRILLPNSSIKYDALRQDNTNCYPTIRYRVLDAPTNAFVVSRDTHVVLGIIRQTSFRSMTYLGASHPLRMGLLPKSRCSGAAPPLRLLRSLTHTLPIPMASHQHTRIINLRSSYKE